VRRIVIAFLLGLVLAPAIASAAQYRCEYDRATYSECNCPMAWHPMARRGEDASEPTARLRAACCCTITQSAPLVRSVWSDPTPFELRAFPAPASAATIAPPALRSTIAPRPRELGGPPSSLLARHCALLL
jgi:hypothetical protein